MPLTFVRRLFCAPPSIASFRSACTFVYCCGLFTYIATATHKPSACLFSALEYSSAGSRSINSNTPPSRNHRKTRYAANMSSISLLNPKAEFARASQALAINISGAKGLQDVMKTNLGPKGTMKM